MTDRPFVLFVSHPQHRCGVHEYGNMVVRQLEQSLRYDVRAADCGGADEALGEIARFGAKVAVFNWHPASMPWGFDAAARCTVPTMGIVHTEVDPASAPFDLIVTMNPDVASDRMIGVPRPIPQARPAVALPNDVIRVGSFGFADPLKQFDRVIELAHQSFENCIVRLNFAPWDFGGVSIVSEMSDRCRAVADRLGVPLDISGEFMSEDSLLEFLATNHINVLLYDDTRGKKSRGIASASDWMLASGRPMALCKSVMFRHFANTSPSIFVEDCTLAEILANGTAPLAPYHAAWSQQAFVAAYERAIGLALAR